MVDGLEIRRLRKGDEELVISAASLFDDPPEGGETARFLDDPLHYLLIALLRGSPAGFASGTRIFHPDKSPQMFLNELGVAEHARNLGVGQALVRELGRIAREDGCAEMWVLTLPDNAPALAAYAKAGGIRDPEQQVMFTFKLLP